MSIGSGFASSSSTPVSPTQPQHERAGGRIGVDRRSLPALLLLIATTLGLPGAAGAQVLTPVQTLFDVPSIPRPLDTTLSSDGAHLYVVDNVDDSISTFARDPVTGSLTSIDVIKDGALDRAGNLVDGLNSVRALTLSEDGQHLYATGFFDSAIALLRRDATSGVLTFVEALVDGGTDGQGNPLDNLDGADKPTLSVDGRHLYVIGFFDSALNVFARDPATGRLTFVETLVEGGSDGAGNPLSCFFFARSLAVSSDDANVYHGSSRDTPSGGPDVPCISVFARDAASGALTLIEELEDGGEDSQGNLIDGLALPNDIALSEDGEHFYGVGGFLASGSIARLRRDTTTGRLIFGEILRNDEGGISGLDDPVSLDLSRNDKHLYIASGEDSSLAVFSRDQQSGELTFVEIIGNLNDPSAVIGSPDGAYVYVTSLDGDAVVLFRRNLATGELTFVERLIDGDSELGLRSALFTAVSPDARHLYSVAFTGALSVFDRDARTGRLSLIEKLQDGGEDGSGNAVNGLSGAQWVTVSDDGLYVYTTASIDRSLSLFARDPATGRLTFVEEYRGVVFGLRGASSVVLSGDGQNVYTAAEESHALSMFSREAVTGRLTLLGVFRDGQGGVDDLQGANAVTVSDDGENVYVVAVDDNALSVFDRDPVTGLLDFVEVHVDGVDGVDGLEAAFGVTVSGDGRHVYVAGGNDDAIAIFDRDTDTGWLTFVEAIFDGVDGVDGLDGVRFLALSGNDRRAYTAASVDDAVTVFDRDPVSGRLSQVEVVLDGVDGAAALDGAAAVALSGAYLYIPSADDNAIQVLSAAVIFVDGFESGDTSAWTPGQP